ncbi:MAG: hypothetical protein U5K00_09360 [Melioribacteraceae bacterium]|nr:hypothetical protein [Melioribacteraceae bacterium]
MKAKKLMKENSVLKDIYNEYKSTADSVHELEKEKMPDTILQNAEKTTEVNITRKEYSFFNDLTAIFFSKPQLAFIATAIVAALLIFSLITKQNNEIDFDNSQYTKNEVELAIKQAKQTLMLVSQILSSTQASVTEDIIPNRVIKPINESFEYVNDLFKKGDI